MAAASHQRCRLVRAVAMTAHLVCAFLAASNRAAGQSAEQRVVLPVVVNEVDQGESEALMRDRDVLVPVDLLERAGFRQPAGKHEAKDGKEFVSLTSLAPAVTYVLNEETLVLSIVVSPELLGHSAFDFAPRPPPRLDYGGDTSAFCNYAVNWYEGLGVEGFAEVGVSLRGPLLYSSASRTVDGTLVRGQTNLTVDERSRLRRWVVGDSFVSGGLLGGSLFLAGVSVTRNFDLDPYFLRYPTLGVSGAVLTPSTADVYVNGALVGREQLRPGEFSFSNLVIPAGSGAAEVVIRDVFGQERVISEPFYASTVLLRRGVSEYAYGLGARRENGTVTGNDYGPLAFLGRHRLGITDSLTAEVRLEGDEHLVSGGTSAALRVLGAEAEAGIAASTGDGRSGSAGFASVRYLGRPLSLGALARYGSEDYRTLGQPTGLSPTKLERSFFIGAELGRRASLTGQYADESWHDGERRVRATLLSSVRVGTRTNLLASVTRSLAEDRWTTEWFVSVSSFFAGTTTASLSYQRIGDGSAVAADIQKSRPLGVGYGYRAGAVAAEGEVNGMLSGEYQGPFGRYAASYQRSGGSDAFSAGISGGIFALGGVVRASQPVRDAFALIRIPGLAGVEGSWSNQPIGRTDRRGDLVIPDLLSYQPNRLAIDDQDVPLDWEVLATERLITLPYRGGRVVEFPVRLHRAVTGTVLVSGPGRDVVPAFGTLAVRAGGEEFRSPIGGRGEFYLENLPAGEHDAEVEFAAGRCTLSLAVPETAEAMVTLGTIRCVQGEMK